jgi:hypothetical protein
VIPKNAHTPIAKGRSGRKLCIFIAGQRSSIVDQLERTIGPIPEISLWKILQEIISIPWRQSEMAFDVNSQKTANEPYSFKSSEKTQS